MRLYHFTIAIILTGLVAACSSSTKKKGDFAEITLDPNTPEYLSKNTTTFFTEATKPKMKMVAETQMRFSDGNEHYPDGIDITTYDEEGKVQSTLVADSAIYYYKENVYTALGNVVLIDKQKNQKLESDTLNFNKDNGDVYTDARVKITSDDLLMYGKGLKANQNDPDNYEILDIEGSQIRD